MVYEYRVISLDKVHDGDTIWATLDVGFYMTRQSRPYRLLRIDSPEMNTQAGKDAQIWLSMFLYGKPLVIQTFKSDSFGRFLAEIVASGENVSDALVSAGHAAYKSYA